MLEVIGSVAVPSLQSSLLQAVQPLSKGLLALALAMMCATHSFCLRIPKDGGIALALRQQGQSLLEIGGLIKMPSMGDFSLKKAQFVALSTARNLTVAQDFSCGNQSTRIYHLVNSRR